MLERLIIQEHVERRRDLLGDVRLHAKRVFRLSIVVLRPQVKAVGCPNELRGNAQPVAVPPNRPLDDMGNAELRSDLGDRYVLALEMKC